MPVTNRASIRYFLMERRRNSRSCRQTGIQKDFKDAKDPLLDRIVRFCGSQNYVKVSENIRDEYFFK